MTESHDDALDAELRAAYTAAGGSVAAREALLERLRRAPLPAARGRGGWFAPIWTLSLAQAVAAIVLVFGAGAGLGMLLAARNTRPSTLVLAQRPGPADDTVTFVLRAPGASQVTVAGDFNGWDAEATPLVRANSGDTWTARVRVPRGLHYYSFVLDKREWRPDPGAPLSPLAAFGRPNSVLLVGEGARW